MRHVVGFIVGMMLAPIVLIGLGWAYPRLAAIAARDGATFVSATGLSAVGVLSVLAVLLGLSAAAPRLTPLLPGIAGLSLVGVTAAHVMRPELIGRLPAVPGMDGAQTLLALGVFLPLSVALIVPMFLPARWRRYQAAHSTDEVEEYFDGLYDSEEEEYEEQPRRRHGRRPSHA
ncbi:hypothetical protein CLV63_104148 [Murinocardiopsis flavida]|uniref:Uncharacterized protein n=1 Tax=Murinocardiopsis flavida TaxID=645275 RepID=A0A2P8DNX0_9ACTN|nr:hypothetical protein [Murinocardiopsis flavida]PSK98924.1 hypothetical protein CLV63_104148 [Murinocardiopsis flavida]